MPATITLADLRLSSQQRADMENSTFLSTPEWTSNLNASYAELYDILVSRFEDYYIQKILFTIAPGADTYTLTSGFYKIRGLDYSNGSGSERWNTVGKWQFADRNKINKAITRDLSGLYDRNYRVMGQQIIILPADKAPGDYRLWQIPRFTPLVSDGDVLGDVLDFEEYVIVDAAIKALIKEESDVQALMMIKQQLKERIEAMASNRDTEPDRITDNSTYYDDYFYWSRF